MLSMYLCPTLSTTYSSISNHMFIKHHFGYSFRYAQFAQLGMRPKHWKEARAIFLITMNHVNPYIEESDKELLSLGVDSCAYRFWTYRVMTKALLAIKEMDEIFDSKENGKLLAKSFEPFTNDKIHSGMLFYQKLFTMHPEVRNVLLKFHCAIILILIQRSYIVYIS